ncbi:MAG: tetratricopeptide repeat protein, partial [bacterium]|nr:tetratricopeptide repeat protein [bacterium]
ADVTRQMAQLYRDRGDESLARELTQRLPNDDALTLGEDDDTGFESSGGDDEMLDDDFLDDDFLGDESEGDSDEDSFIDIGGEDDLDVDLTAEDESLEPPADSTAAEPEPELPEGDPDQLFAEASVYLRYGKRDQAITSLEAILAQEPRHRDALEKIGECYADAGDAPRAVEYWTDAAGLATRAGDDASVDVLRERIAVLDPDAAAAIGPLATAPVQASEPAADASSAVVVDDDFELDLDMDLEDEVQPSAADESDEISLDESLQEMSADDVEIEVEDDGSIEIDIEGLDEAEDESEEVDEQVEITEEVEISGLDEGDATAGDPAQGQSSVADSQKLAEDLEEAEFYMEQQLFDEAEAIYKRVLEASPNHPSAMVRLGELQTARGEDPTGVEAAAPVPADVTLDPSELPFEQDDSDDDEGIDAAAGDADAEAELGEDSELEIAVEFDLDLEDEGQESEPVQASDAADLVADDVEFASEIDAEGIDLDDAPLGPDEEDVEVEFDDDSDDTVNADNTMPLIAEGDELEGAEAIEISAAESDATDAHVVEEEAGDQALEVEVDEAAEEEGVEAEMVAAECEETPPEPVDQADEDDSFDLAAELRESLEEEEDQGETTASGDTTSEEEGFASIFRDFKSGVEKTLGEDDFDTRFDLGIAYRGMELYDDALGEFRICLDSPGHRVESLHMMGLCAIDLERFADASNHLEQALASEDVPEPKEAGLRFDLGRAFEGLEDFARAKEAFEAAKSADATIPGIDECVERVAERLAGGEESVQLEAEPVVGESFEDFDDLVAEVEASDEPEAEEAFESFDDVVAEVEVSETAAQSAADDEAKKRKKKRISFV